MSISSIVAIAGGGQGSDAGISPGRDSLDVISVTPSSTSFLRGGGPDVNTTHHHHYRDHYPRANIVRNNDGTSKGHHHQQQGRRVAGGQVSPGASHGTTPSGRSRHLTPPPTSVRQQQGQHHYGKSPGLARTHREVSRMLRNQLTTTEGKNSSSHRKSGLLYGSSDVLLDQPYVSAVVQSPFLAAPSSTTSRLPTTGGDTAAASNTAPPPPASTNANMTPTTPIQGHSRSELIVRLQRENTDLKAELDSQIGFLAILQERLSQEQEFANYRRLVLEAETAQRDFLQEQEQEAFTLLCTFESVFVKQLIEAENNQHQRDVLHAMEIQSVIEEAGSVTSELQKKLLKYEAQRQHTEASQTEDVIIVEEEKKPPQMVDSATSMYVPQYLVNSSIAKEKVSSSSPDPRNPRNVEGEGSQPGFIASDEVPFSSFVDDENGSREGPAELNHPARNNSAWMSTRLLETPLDLYLDTLDRPQFFTQLYAAVRKRQGGGDLFGQEVPWVSSSSMQTIPEKENLGLVLKKRFESYIEEAKGLLSGHGAAGEAMIFESLYVKRPSCTRSTWCTFGAASKWPHVPLASHREQGTTPSPPIEEGVDDGAAATPPLFSLIDTTAEQPYNPAQQLDRAKVEIASLKSENRRFHFQVARMEAVADRALSERELAVDQVVNECQLRVKLETRLKEYESLLGELDAELHVETLGVSPTPRKKAPKPTTPVRNATMLSPGDHPSAGTSALEALALATTPIAKANDPEHQEVMNQDEGKEQEEEWKLLVSEFGDDVERLRCTIVSERREFKKALQRALSVREHVQLGSKGADDDGAPGTTTRRRMDSHQHSTIFLGPLLKSLAKSLGDATDCIPKAIAVLKKVKKAIHEDNQDLDAAIHAQQHAAITAAMTSSSATPPPPAAVRDSTTAHQPQQNLPYRKRLWSVKAEAQESISRLAEIQMQLMTELTKDHMEILVESSRQINGNSILEDNRRHSTSDDQKKRNSSSIFPSKGLSYVDHNEVGWYSPRDENSPPPPRTRRQRTPLRQVTNTQHEPLSTSRDPVLSRGGYAHRGNQPVHVASPWTSSGAHHSRKGPGIYYQGKGAGASSPRDQQFLW